MHTSTTLPKSQKMACKHTGMCLFSEKKCRYGFQVAKEVLVCYTGPYCPTYNLPM